MVEATVRNAGLQLEFNRVLLTTLLTTRNSKVRTSQRYASRSIRNEGSNFDISFG